MKLRSAISSASGSAGEVAVSDGSSSRGAIERVIDTLNELGVAYVVVGSFSSMFYGNPRFTKDADFVIETDDDIGRLAEALRPEFRMESQIGFETKLMTTKFAFEHVETDFLIEVFLLSDDPHDRARFERRQQKEREGRVFYLPTAEDVIIQKLRWRRQKDLDDVADVMAVQADRLDWAYLHRWCDEHDTRGLLDELRAETGV